MTELDVLIEISEKIDLLIHVGQQCVVGLAFISAAFMVIGWLYARVDREF